MRDEQPKINSQKENSNDNRTVFGVGPKWALISLALSAPLGLIAWVTYPWFVFDLVPAWTFYTVGGTLFCLGFALYIWGVRTMLRAFRERRLVTTHAFGVCRNPIYGAWIVWIMPGIALVLRMPVLLAVPIIMYLVFRILIPQEEKDLARIFGDEYLKYLERVNAVFPTLGICPGFRGKCEVA